MAWGVAFAATVGSLFFQYGLNFPPCVLCWYQRIFIYPLVVILGVGIMRRDAASWISALVLTSVGLLISIYHNLLYYHVLSEGFSPCVQGVSCTDHFVSVVGVLDIPQLSLLAFISIFVLLISNKGTNYDERS